MIAEDDCFSASGVECIAGGARVVIASSDIDEVVEYEVSPLPRARQWVGGIAAHRQEIVVSIALGAATDGDAARRPTKAILLCARSPGGARFGVEVDELLGFVEVRPSGDAGENVPWLTPVMAEDERELTRLDVRRLVDVLGHDALTL